MADDKFILSVDDDWKKQAQEEKRRLAEEQAKKAAAPAPGAGPTPPGGAPAAGPRQRKPGEAPEASFSGLVQSLLTQTLFYLGDLGGRGGQSGMNLDMARYQVDLLGVLDEKSKGNLTEAEQQMLDVALYEARNRFVAVSSQFIGP